MRAESPADSCDPLNGGLKRRYRPQKEKREGKGATYWYILIHCRCNMSMVLRCSLTCIAKGFLNGARHRTEWRIKIDPAQVIDYRTHFQPCYGSDNW